MLAVVFLIASLVCFILAAFNVASPRVGLVPLGLALWVAAELLPRIV